MKKYLRVVEREVSIHESSSHVQTPKKGETQSKERSRTQDLNISKREERQYLPPQIRVGNWFRDLINAPNSLRTLLLCGNIMVGMRRGPNMCRTSVVEGGSKQAKPTNVVERSGKQAEAESIVPTCEELIDSLVSWKVRRCMVNIGRPRSWAVQHTVVSRRRGEVFDTVLATVDAARFLHPRQKSLICLISAFAYTSCPVALLCSVMSRPRLLGGHQASSTEVWRSFSPM